MVTVPYAKLFSSRSRSVQVIELLLEHERSAFSVAVTLLLGIIKRISLKRRRYETFLAHPRLAKSTSEAFWESE